MEKYEEFMGPNNCGYDGAEFVIVPIPFEGNVSWKGGASKGPAAIIRASYELEYYDYEIMFDLNRIKRYTLKSIKYDEIKRTVKRIFDSSKFPVCIGGDHSISIPILQNLPEDVSILHVDAHLDMRSSYLGNASSHACAMYEASKNHNVVHVGVRSGCEEDISNAKKFGNKIFKVRELKNIIENLGEDVYITFDVDAFDPSIMPATGTPEPGGITWDEANYLMETVCRKKNVVGADFVELSPQSGMHFCDSTVAKMIARCMAYSMQG